MPRRMRIAPLAVLLTTLGCGGSSPSAPTPTGTAPSSPPTLAGLTVSAIDGQPIGGVTVKIGSRTAVSDTNGAFQLENVSDGNQAANLTGASIVERRTIVSTPTTDPVRASLIPATFDLTAFDQMFRSPNARLQRWTSAPSLVVLTTVMNYTRGIAEQDEYYATSEQLSEAETVLLIDQLTEALALLTGNTFARFASIERESVPLGAKGSTNRMGKIVVGRYKGVEGLINTIGFGRWATLANGDVVGGAMYLDRDFDKSSEARRLLRTHELGHALGYSHVTTRTSIMNPAIGPEATSFDRQGATIAFQRSPGNQAPDTDPGMSAFGAVFNVAPGATSPVWSPPIICGPRN